MIKNRICALLISAITLFSGVSINAASNENTLSELVLRDVITLENTPQDELIDTLSDEKKISVSIEQPETDEYQVVMNAEYDIDSYDEQWTLVYIVKDENDVFYSYGYYSDWFDPQYSQYTYTYTIPEDSYSKLTEFTIKAFVVESIDNLKPLSTVASKKISRDDGKTTVSDVEYIKSLCDSYNPNNNLTYSVAGNNLQISGKISSSDKKWIWSFLTPVKGDTSTKYAESIVQKGSDNSYSSSADLSNLADGTYYLYLLSSSTQYSYYTSFVTGSVAVYVEDGESFFALPKTIYENNISLRENETNPPEYFINQNYPSDHTIWVHQDDDTIYEKALEITQDCDTEYEMIEAIHDWVAENVYYNYDYYYGYSSENPVSDLEVLEKGYSVCHGYSNLFASLCRSLSIPCKVVTGYGLNSSGDWSGNTEGENHAWNEAYIEAQDRWVIVDCTWDSSNKKLNGEFEKGTVSKTYFDITDEFFSFNHRADSYYNK